MEIDDEEQVPQPIQSAVHLPGEIQQIIRLQKTPRFLDALALATLQPQLTLKLFTIYEAVFADTFARLAANEGRKNEIIEAFARILPLAPHFSVILNTYLEGRGHQTAGLNMHNLFRAINDKGWLQKLQLQRILLATWRLLNFDKGTYSRIIESAMIQGLLEHEDRAVRYLAVRVFCQLLSAADFKLEAMIKAHVGKEKAILGDFDGKEVDLIFLSLYEQKRLEDAQSSRNHFTQTDYSQFRTFHVENLSPKVVRYGSVLLPRPYGAPSSQSTLVITPTTSTNMECLAKSLLSSCPILLHGLAGSGKTSLVNDFAREFGMDSNMVTLHLNEQTDAKMLIGMYTTGSTPGTFSWAAGVLTTAVREGRWVFIEDLDRAPNEVISVILPLIERRELLIPSRGEIIKAGPGFRLLASIRTSLSVTGHENPPALHMLGARLWQRVPVKMPCQDEFRQIINEKYPILHLLLPQIINVYDRLCTLSRNPEFISRSRASLGRPTSSRDLLKWCRRLEGVLLGAGSMTSRELINDSVHYEMFMEATDCFAGNLQNEDSRKTVISVIAEEMHIDPIQVEHFIGGHIPQCEETQKYLCIGRVHLAKNNSCLSNSIKKQRFFANTSHAKRLMEQVGVALRFSEPVLLVGETGIGKTTVIQQLADILGHKLTVVNLSQQSEIGDLLGGFKPVNVRNIAIPLKDEFEDLFALTGISPTRNQKYLDQLRKCIAKGQWSKASKFWREAPKMFSHIISELQSKENNGVKKLPTGSEQSSKRRKTESRLQNLAGLKPRWERFSANLDQFDMQLSGGSKGFAFTFIEGKIIKAARHGEWVLLDEINLASPDTLESIADLLHSGSEGSPSILLSETGEMERVKAHPNFRIFGAMNPATDVGKRDLPLGLRSRFTELYVESPDRNLENLLPVIRAYLKGSISNDEKAAHDVAKLYLNTKRLTDEKRLVDGANQVPHFSLRTLTRVLSYVTETSPIYGLRRALYEGFAMGFLTLLNCDSEKMLMPLIDHHILGTHKNVKALLSQTPKQPDDGKQYVPFTNRKRDRHYWLLGGHEPCQEQRHYIITPSVDRNMLNLVRAISTRRFPVLIQGPTSSGKTSMIEYLAKHTGNKFVRINNHEHTDLQEYLGNYVSGSDGQLFFQEGLLVQALRQGHWIVLDELNLAPTDVLESLNRLLDDNRELLIPETQEVVRPHENFMLFATQNPPGLYGGRKTLSRAFRNRFLELHFDDIPEGELEIILQTRCQDVAPSDCGRIVKIYHELSKRRQSTRLFEQKDSFATLRDLFRWALRGYETREQLAANGYMLLAERVRNPEERNTVKEVIEKFMKVKIDPIQLYDTASSPEIQAYNSTSNSQDVVWTQAMRRLYVLVSHALRNDEPVLLVGETGCGKTTVCQMLADALSKELYIVNAHQNTETGDLIGAQRPVRNRVLIRQELKSDLLMSLNRLGHPVAENEVMDNLLAVYRSFPESTLEKLPTELRNRIEQGRMKANTLFEWSDGSLVQAMKEGQMFLLDEISLADDSVLERLNSVLETQRTVLLAEKGTENSFVQAVDGFQFFATMNPGGDYGKRELSPALRNRFTEIWVPALSEYDDLFQIVKTKLKEEYKPFAMAMVNFAEWFGRNFRASITSISIRDMLAWVKFINKSESNDLYFSVTHGAAMVYIDTLGANPAALLAIDLEHITEARGKCLQQLSFFLDHDINSIYFKPINLINDEKSLKIGDFSVRKQPGSNTNPAFAFDAPTTKLNALRLIRALQLEKPILIEGSPGVGKTTLVSAIAHVCNRQLTRINLSDQTDLMDLFGSDVPVEGADAGHFAWRDSPFLRAMQKGEWVLLDEMNLASQSVLEGLNACLDHRGEVYISELDRKFKCHPEFCVFAAQNPHHQGGGRKGLPSSFVNRFTVVYADIFKEEDLDLVCKGSYPAVPESIVSNIISFVLRLQKEVSHLRRFGSQGGPWEFNLRDILRWLKLLTSNEPLLGASKPSDFLNLVFRQRFRNPKDRVEVDKIFAQVFSSDIPYRHLFHNISSSSYQVGISSLLRDKFIQRTDFPPMDPIYRLPEIESIMICIKKNIPCILVGSSGSGKTSTLQHIAAMAGNKLAVFPINSDIDTMDLVGGYEQVDPQRAASAFLEDLSCFFREKILSFPPAEIPEEALTILEILERRLSFRPSCLADLATQIRFLHAKTSLAELEELAQSCQKLYETPLNLENACFEWVDSILVNALKQGKWIVLDNANLCNASVLDRLNSLLEPNGVLSINEHSGPDGEPKIVKPHPDFRIFLTMDARFGELSRAMRNRAVEVYFDPLPALSNLPKCSLAVHTESSMQRFRNVSKVLEQHNADCSISKTLFSASLDNLSWSDMPLLSRYNVSEDSHTSQEWSLTCSAYISFYEEAANKKFMALLRTVGAIENQLSTDAQIVHPLQNSPLVSLIVKSQDSEHLFWLGAVFEFIVEIKDAMQMLSCQKNVAHTLQPSKMNRLQRSLIKERVPAVAKDSTAKIWEFLYKTLTELKVYLQNYTSIDTQWKEMKGVISSLLRYWWETFHLSTMPVFEEATFQAHLMIGNDLFSKLINNGCSVVQVFKSSLESDFSSEFTLSTGLSMELLWKFFRPLTFPNATVLDTLAKMEELGARFDSLRWKTSISIIELGSVMSALVQAYRFILTSEVDGCSLVQILTQEMESLEKNVTNFKDTITPFFQKQFEAIRQYQALQGMRRSMACDASVETLVLSNYPTSIQMGLSTSTNIFQMVDFFWGLNDTLYPASDKICLSLLEALNRMAEVDLKSLKLLESELPILGQKFSLSSASLCRDQMLDLNHVLMNLIGDVIRAHGEVIASDLSDIGNFVSVGNHTHLGKIVHDHFILSARAIKAAKSDPSSKFKFSALAWIQFAIGTIKLYVPDRIFDPDKRQRLERQQYEAAKNLMSNKLDALCRFERLVSGQDSNLRIQLIRSELLSLAEPPANLQRVYRPKISEMEQLQGEFSNLLNTILRSHVLTEITDYFDNEIDTNNRDQNLQQIRLLQCNVTQVIQRLATRFRAYNDLTKPVISILHCLQIGLSLAVLPVSRSPQSLNFVQLSQIAPFMGSNDNRISEKKILSCPMEYFALVATKVSIEGLETLASETKKSILKAFHACYNQWVKKLEADRIDFESKYGLYRFRGSFDDEDEVDYQQFNQLFPSYEEDSLHQPTASSTSDARDMAIKLAQAHADIIIGGTTSVDCIFSLIRTISWRLGTSHDNDLTYADANMDSKLLPGGLLLLTDKIEALSSSAATPESYNFYTDANIPESRNLVALIHLIQLRFRELQAIDEIAHMQPLEDVLVSCCELLEFRHTEPLAKLITKVEKIHGFMHEWQFGGWASRAYSALSLYENITAKIVTWRRLELSTWAKLFDIETAKCIDDAKSWWFLAYQVVVAIPLQLIESKHELESYVQKLLKDLESYFSSAVLGQFALRIQLLKQLLKHVQLLQEEIPAMSTIANALAHFLALYSRYEEPVRDNLKRGRSTLEKTMRDLLLMASWKDTNIVALRDSAKRSHYKLFKILRKFRALLSQPVDVILKQPLPDEAIVKGKLMVSESLMLSPTVDPLALEMCASSFPEWPNKSKRLVKISSTIGKMADAALVPESALDISLYLESFTENIISSTTELQNATPSILTEHNTNIVKHLKSRKKKLFSDTLKDLRQMGIKHNLSSDALRKQDCLSTVLASTKYVEIFNIEGLEYCFYKCVDIVPRARDSAKQHSEDLSSAEVSRSMGLLEGLLQRCLSQHNFLSISSEIKNLEVHIQMVKGLWSQNYALRNATTTSNHEKVLRWLPNILRVGLTLIQMHSQLGKIDSESIQENLQNWIDCFTNFTQRWNSLAQLPIFIDSTEHILLRESINDAAKQLDIELANLRDTRPDLTFITTQITPWTRIVWGSVTKDSNFHTHTISELDSKLSNVCDTALVALEKYKNTLILLPTSVEDPSWLVNSDFCLRKSLKALSVPTVCSRVQEAFAILAGIDLKNDDIGKSAGACFAVALPILQQYLVTVQDSLVRYAHLHRTTCKTTYILAKTFIQIATQGFCGPSEKSDAQDQEIEKLEGGTGLGDGEGVEDITKDIQGDEDLDELAQEPNSGENGDIEEEQNAVDMANGELEAETFDTEKNEDEEASGNEDTDDLDEEAGDVDDLDPTAIDEKMWDGDGEQADKDQEGDEPRGKQSKNEQAAAQENGKDVSEGDEGNEEDMEAAEQGEDVTQDDIEKHDPHANEGEALDLPDDMDLGGDGDDKSVSSVEDGMEDLSDVEDPKVEDEMTNGDEVLEIEDLDHFQEEKIDSEIDAVGDEEEQEKGGKQTEDAGAEGSEHEQSLDEEGLLRDRDDCNADADNPGPSDVKGTGEDQNDEFTDKITENSSQVQRDDGSKGGDSSGEQSAPAEDGEKGRQANGNAPEDAGDETQDSTDAQPFKKLGDALEKWHRQQNKIHEHTGQQNTDDHKMNLDNERPDFQHLQDEDAIPDAQALGTATEEQAHGLDESMAIDQDANNMPTLFQPNEIDGDNINDSNEMDPDESNTHEQEHVNAHEGRAGAMIKKARDNNDNVDAHFRVPEIEQDIREFDDKLESDHLQNEISLRSSAESRRQWTHYEGLTRDLSLSLTEQLRLILAPTLATKMRGDFRSGKRLNIKRIIPYIASQYKRDKIWMRRSIPSKRNYQIMLAVDDSKSMGEIGSGSLAFETLVMVSKSLNMLEVGEICVVGFGDDVKVAHDFVTPFSSDAGAKILQQFSFRQNRTDVARLVRETIEIFRSARAKASGGPTDLWQMELIISDGVCESRDHDEIRRLLREALEERIMMVFVIVDDVKNKKGAQSVMDLNQASFVNGTIITSRYLDTFPFQYYIVVSDVKELPGVLATLLRQWFSEVVDSN